MKSKHRAALLLAVGLITIARSGLAVAGSPIGWGSNISQQSVNAVSPSVAYNPGREEYSIWYNEWADNDDIEAQQASIDGVLTGGTLHVAAGAGGNVVGSPVNISQQTNTNIRPGQPSVAYNSVREEYLVVWYNDRPGNDDIQARRIPRSGVPVEGPFWISSGPGAERSHPDVAYNSRRNEYLVVWEHNAGSGPEIHAVPVPATGGVDSTKEVVIATTFTSAPYRPAVAYAYTSDKYLVVWYEEGAGFSNILGQVLNSDGTLSGSNFVISQDPGGSERYNPDVAYNRSRNEYLVVWQQKDPTYGDYDIYARRVQGNGTPMYPAATTIRYTSKDQILPVVAAIPSQSTGGQYLVAWEDHQSCGTVACIEAQLVKADGTIDGNHFSVAWDVTAGDYVQPAVAGGESRQQYFVTWTEPWAGFANTSIGGYAISVDGKHASEAASFGLFAGESAVSAGAFGDFLVAFSDTGLVQVNIYAQLWGNRIYVPLVLRNR